MRHDKKKGRQAGFLEANGATSRVPTGLGGVYCRSNGRSPAWPTLHKGAVTIESLPTEVLDFCTKGCRHLIRTLCHQYS